MVTRATRQSADASIITTSDKLKKSRKNSVCPVNDSKPPSRIVALLTGPVTSAEPPSFDTVQSIFDGL